MNLRSSTVSPSRPLKVLVAEDNIINQRVVVGLLTQLGHTGMVVKDGEKALKCLAKMQVDVVLMDVMIPVMDGLEALAAIRAQEAHTGRHLPIVMATSHDERGEALRYEKAGAYGYLCKPLDLDGLRAEIERVLRRT